VQLPSLCCTNDCSIAEHDADINTYSQVVNACISRLCVLSSHKDGEINEYSIAGWPDLVADKHEGTRQGSCDWVVMVSQELAIFIK